MKIALSHAHAQFAQGATYQWYAFRKQAEWPKSKAINEMVAVLMQSSEYEIQLVDPETPGEDYHGHLRKTVSEINAIKPDVAVEFHFNACTNPKAQGYEVLYQENDLEGRKLAFTMFRVLEGSSLPLIPRGVVPRDNLMFLNGIRCPAVIIEGGFLSNPNDFHFIHSIGSTEIFAKCLVKGLVQYAEAAGL